jgi:hypothetical protein
MLIDTRFGQEENVAARLQEDFMQRPRTPAQLSESIQQQLNMYALAAGAAGVSFLALAQPAQAKIVYTAAHVKIGAGGVGSYDLDLNRDGVTDFSLSTGGSCDVVRCFYSFNVYGKARSNGIVFEGRGRGRKLAQAMPRGAVIGGKRHFGSEGGMADATYFTTGKGYVTGHWLDATNRYLGLRFQVNGATHYGWARLSVEVVKQPWSVNATLTGYAYETIPNRPIIAGRTHGKDDAKDASLGALAAGAPFRARRQK